MNSVARKKIIERFGDIGDDVFRAPGLDHSVYSLRAAPDLHDKSLALFSPFLIHFCLVEQVGRIERKKQEKRILNASLR